MRNCMKYRYSGHFKIWKFPYVKAGSYSVHALDGLQKTLADWKILGLKR